MHLYFFKLYSSIWQGEHTLVGTQGTSAKGRNWSTRYLDLEPIVTAQRKLVLKIRSRTYYKRQQERIRTGG